MELSRKQFARTLVGAAVMAAAKPLFPTCVYGLRTRQANCDPTQNCAYLGMTGRWPNCYFPQYAYLNRPLTAAFTTTRVSVAHAVRNRTITRLAWSRMIAYNTQYASHLLTTHINEGVRKQWILPRILDVPVLPGQASVIQRIGAEYGFSSWTVDTAIENLYNTMPMSGNASLGPTLEQKVNALPDAGSWDNIFAYENGLQASVTVENAICQFIGNPATIEKAGDIAMGVGSALTLLAPEAGLPALVLGAVMDVGKASLVVGLADVVVATMCEY